MIDHISMSSLQISASLYDTSISCCSQCITLPAVPMQDVMNLCVKVLAAVLTTVLVVVNLLVQRGKSAALLRGVTECCGCQVCCTSWPMDEQSSWYARAATQLNFNNSNINFKMCFSSFLYLIKPPTAISSLLPQNHYTA
jgi:hypothetical protein